MNEWMNLFIAIFNIIGQRRERFWVDTLKGRYINVLLLLYMRPHEPDPPSPCGRPHAVDMKYTSLSWKGSYNDLPKAEIRLGSMIVIYLKLYY